MIAGIISFILACFLIVGGCTMVMNTECDMNFGVLCLLVLAICIPVGLLGRMYEEKQKRELDDKLRRMTPQQREQVEKMRREFEEKWRRLLK